MLADEIVARLSAESSRRPLHQRSLLHCLTPSASSSSSMSLSSLNLSSPPRLAPSASAMDDLTLPSSVGVLDLTDRVSPSHHDVPVFTLKQVGLVCERMLREKEEQIREEYDRTLACRLSGSLIFLFFPYFSLIYST